MSVQDVEVPNKVIRLSNRTCPYCGCNIDEVAWDRDHVIGRRFVPRGSLESSWNVLAKTCMPCNNTKSDLEDDISAITMFRLGGYASKETNALVLAEGARKAAGSISRLTGKPVAQSTRFVTFTGRLGPATVSATLQGPPAAEPDRIFRLALMHVQAIFYFYTFNKEEKTGYSLVGDYAPVLFAPRSDWGNNVLQWFTDFISTWDDQIFGSAADGNFKVLVKVHPEGKPITAWALEWNKNYRMIGFFAETEELDELESKKPALSGYPMHRSGGASMRVREHVPLKGEDRLFTITS